MNPDQPTRPEIEARITALLLGELSADEARVLRWAIAQDPELARLEERLRQTIGLVRTAAGTAEAGESAGLKMSPERREKLLAHFKTPRPAAPMPAPKPEPVPVPVKKLNLWDYLSRPLPMGHSLLVTCAVLVLCAVLAAMLLPALAASKQKAKKVAALAQVRQEKLQRQLEEEDKGALHPSEVVTVTPPTTPAAAMPAVPPPAFVGSPVQIDKAKGPTFAKREYRIVLPADTAMNTVPRAQYGIGGASGGITYSTTGGGGGGAGGGGANGGQGGAFGGGRGGGAGGGGYDGVNGDSLPSDHGNGVVENFYDTLPSRGNLRIPLPPNQANGNASLTDLTKDAPSPSDVTLGWTPVDPATGLPVNAPTAEAPKAEPEFSGRLSPAAPMAAPQPLSSGKAGEAWQRFVTNGVTVNGANEFRFAAANSTIVAGGEIVLPDNNGADRRSGVTDRFLSYDGSVKRPVVVANNSSATRQKQLQQDSATALAVLEQQHNDQQQAIGQALGAVRNLRPSAQRTGTAPAAAPSSVDRQGEPVTPRPRASTETPVPQPEVQTADNAFSTFSLNVSDVSFQLTAASLQNGRLPDPAAIRTEEFINAFDYRDPEAAPGAPVAFATEQAAWPFAHHRDLLRFSLKTAATGRAADRPLNLVLLLDNSGSMERADRVAIIREALRVLATQLRPQDTVSVVTFARTARLWADGIAGDRADAVFQQVGGLTPEGGTNLEEALRLAYEAARRHFLQHGLNRVVMLTDGAANLGTVDAKVLRQKVETGRKAGVNLDCFGIGWEDYNDDLLAQLASNGGGRYAFLNSPAEATGDFAAKLAGALQVAAEDVKVQVEFNARRVVSWRQLGYAKHQLKQEEFRDNSVHAASIAAQEAGNALYTVELNPQGEGPVATVHIRYRTPGTQEYHEHEWVVPYTGTAPAFDRASTALRLAGSAAAFAEWLTGSPYAEEVTPDELLRYLSGVPAAYGADPRPQKLEWMIRQAKSQAGK